MQCPRVRVYAEWKETLGSRVCIYMNMWCTCVCISAERNPSSVTVGPWGTHRCSFSRYCPSVFQSNYTVTSFHANTQNDPCGRWHRSPFQMEETEAQRGEVTFTRSGWWPAVEVGLEPRSSPLQSLCVLSVPRERLSSRASNKETPVTVAGTQPGTWVTVYWHLLHWVEYEPGIALGQVQGLSSLTQWTWASLLLLFHYYYLLLLLLQLLLI